MGRAVAEVRPIEDADLPDVARFLHAHLNPRLSVSDWERAVRPSWSTEVADHGFLLRAPADGDDTRIVGVYLAFHSVRRVDGAEVPICNLAGWCVLEEFRDQAVRLLRSQLGRRGVTFTDLSPSGNVVAMNERLKFRRLDQSTFLVPHLPVSQLPVPGRRRQGRVSISAAPADLEAELGAADLQIYRDHREALAAHHLLLRDGDERGYLMFRHDRRRGLPLFASLLYVSRPDLLQRAWPLLRRHLLIRHRRVATLAETHVVGDRPPLSVPVSQNRPKMFRSTVLAADQVDYLYSELACVPW